MTVKDCIASALDYLGLDRTIEQLNNNETNEEIALLFRFAKNVIEEICCDYFPLKTYQNVNFSGGKVDLSGLNESPVDIIKVKYAGESVPFRLFFDRIEAEIEGKAQVYYSYLPKIGELADELPFGTRRISARLIGFGIAAEYCIVNGMTEAITFDKKFRDGLLSAAENKRSQRVKGRIWA